MNYYRNYEEFSFDVGDMTVKFFTNKEEILNSIRSATIEHKHAFCEFFYIVKGKMQIESEGVVYNIEENDAVLVPQKTLHKSMITEDSQRVAVTFEIFKKRNKSMELCFDKFNILTENGVMLFKNFPAGDSFRRLARYYYGNYKEKHHLIRSCLYEIISFAKEVAERSQPEQSILLSDSTFYRKHIIDAYMHSESADRSIAELARILYLSRQQTYRIIKKFYGKSFEECMQETKMKKAAQLIKETDLSFAQISEKIGYKSTNNFFAAFKKYYGITPLSYKENAEK